MTFAFVPRGTLGAAGAYQTAGGLDCAYGDGRPPRTVTRYCTNETLARIADTTSDSSGRLWWSLSNRLMGPRVSGSLMEVYDLATMRCEAISTNTISQSPGMLPRQWVGKLLSFLRFPKKQALPIARLPWSSRAILEGMHSGISCDLRQPNLQHHHYSNVLGPNTRLENAEDRPSNGLRIPCCIP